MGVNIEAEAYHFRACNFLFVFLNEAFAVIITLLIRKIEETYSVHNNIELAQDVMRYVKGM
jgi:hypothetical protein